MVDFIQLKIKIPRRARSTRRINGKGIKFKLQHPLPVIYKDIRLDCGYRVDLLVDDDRYVL